MALAKIGHGKVRELYDAGDGYLLMVATDRISAYDVVLDDPIPDKGKVLTGLTLFFASRIEDIVPTHVVTADPSRFPQEWRQTPGLEDAPGRAMLVRKLEMIPVEFVVRGYLFGSAYKEYSETGKVAGIELPAGMKVGEELERPILTPTTKAQVGHDEPLTHAEAAELCGPDLFDEAHQKAVSVFSRAAGIAREAGLILADTKFEFGTADGELVLADEILTPDSSRFWAASDYKPGSSPPSYDKQFVRDYLDSTGWDRNPPPPRLPQDVVDATAERYRKAYEMLVGEPFEEYAARYGEVRSP